MNSFMNLERTTHDDDDEERKRTVSVMFVLQNIWRDYSDAINESSLNMYIVYKLYKSISVDYSIEYRFHTHL